MESEELQSQETFTWTISNEQKKNRMSREEYLEECKKVEDTAYAQKGNPTTLVINYCFKT